MDELTAGGAYQLLIKDVIFDSTDCEKPENRWVWHSFNVAEACGRIAKQLGLDDNYAMSLGYVHDIGRKISHVGHPILGYQLMDRLGYREYGRSCITHSFINNDITLTAGTGPSGNSLLFLEHALKTLKLTPYDNIVQISDLFCTAEGFTTIEKRLLDITKRKGVTEHSKEHYESVIALKEKLESEMGVSLYSLFPEIAEEDLQNCEKDRQALLDYIESKQKEKRLD